MTSRRAGTVTLTPAMARLVWGWIFEGREHLHEGSSILARFRKAGYGQPSELAGQERFPIPMPPPGEGTVISADQIRGAVEDVRSEAQAQAELAREHAQRAAAHPGQIQAVPSGVGAGVTGPPVSYADPEHYGSVAQMLDKAKGRAQRDHGVAAGTVPSDWT